MSSSSAESPLRQTASTSDPMAPTEAASVGVANPPRIEPSTMKISASGAISARSSETAASFRALVSGGIAGDHFGLSQATSSR